MNSNEIGDTEVRTATADISLQWAKHVCLVTLGVSKVPGHHSNLKNNYY